MNTADPFAALRGLRIGCVKYLNSRPLIRAYDGPVVFEHPSALARMLAAHELDVALDKGTIITGTFSKRSETRIITS